MATFGSDSEKVIAKAAHVRCNSPSAVTDAVEPSSSSPAQLDSAALPNSAEHAAAPQADEQAQTQPMETSANPNLENVGEEGMQQRGQNNVVEEMDAVEETNGHSAGPGEQARLPDQVQETNTLQRCKRTLHPLSAC